MEHVRIAKNVLLKYQTRTTLTPAILLQHRLQNLATYVAHTQAVIHCTS